ncbi:MAG: hypothetical protein JSV76_01975 [Candidatus Bathyarchaeota archaeon]|nr:MAG: hypothetical protein JSV76_01975 [Candidatus Bathyarchaeota archaeon]
MTHTLHRRGTVKSLQNDYIWQVYPSKGVNDDHVPEKLNAIINIVDAIGSPNWGDVYTGCTLFHSIAQIRQNLKQGSKLRGVFTDKQQLTQFLKNVKEADIGLSVVISGLFNEVFQACENLGLQPHSVNLSLGIWGNKQLLPQEKILEITTMCGHSLISPQLVQPFFEEAEQGTKTPAELGVLLAKQCPCGVFNHIRAGEIIREHANSINNKEAAN